MAKRPTARFVCQACGAVTSKWSGRCDACGEWNTIVEEAVEPTSRETRKRAGRLTLMHLDGDLTPPPRIQTLIAEFDRVLGGGLVPASVVLVGGDPGIGKSTLLLQATCALAQAGRRVLYVSGEEAVDQIRLRARRLKLDAPTLDLAASINVSEIAGSLEQDRVHHVVVIDSIQTMWLETIESAPGS
ncbi:ATPase domain-containing protein, partial [Asaia sp. SF2.1]